MLPLTAAILVALGLCFALMRESFDRTRGDMTPPDDYRPHYDRRRGQRRDATAPKDFTPHVERRRRGRRFDD